MFLLLLKIVQIFFSMLEIQSNLDICLWLKCNCTQERQSIIKYWLDNLRAKQGEVLHNIHFLEGQPIGMLLFIMLEPVLAVPHLVFM